MEKSIRKTIVGKLSKIVLFIILSLFSCRENINNVSKNEIGVYSFEELPKDVQEIFTGKVISNDQSILTNLDTLSKYKIEVVKTGPYTDYYVLIDENTNSKFKIDYGEAFPFVVFRDTLYIAKQYNVRNMEMAEIAKYKKYSLLTE